MKPATNLERFQTLAAYARETPQGACWWEAAMALLHEINAQEAADYIEPMRQMALIIEAQRWTMDTLTLIAAFTGARADDELFGTVTALVHDTVQRVKALTDGPADDVSLPADSPILH